MIVERALAFTPAASGAFGLYRDLREIYGDEDGGDV
jgi:hypothetical protein